MTLPIGRGAYLLSWAAILLTPSKEYKEEAGPPLLTVLPFALRK